MITKFKIYESVSVPYKVGDYALIKLRNKGTLYENVLVKIIKIETGVADILVKILDSRIERMFKKDDMNIIITNEYIQCWSDNKKELELIRTANKYNL